VRVHAAGPSAVLFEVDSLAQAQRLYTELRRRHAGAELSDLADIVPAARTVLVIASENTGQLSALVSELRQWVPSRSGGVTGAMHELPIRYDGEDLPLVGELSGLSTDQVIHLHSRTRYDVAFCGFCPGFAYLAGLPPQLQVPRRSTPRTFVDGGAVALAGEFTAVYPVASPGGWQIVGHTDARMWDAGRTPPALLSPGDRVRFVP
jgi:KipI family sensor histidine kinase inhibitor